MRRLSKCLVPSSRSRTVAPTHSPFTSTSGALENVARFGGNLALLYIDLDKFKQVNDRFGHHTGDLLLCEVAQRIRGHLREGDVVGRMGGDEFVVLLCRLQSIADSISVAEKLRAAIHAPFRLADRTLRASTSVGVATYPLHGQSTRELMRAADVATMTATGDNGDHANGVEFAQAGEDGTWTSATN